MKYLYGIIERQEKELPSILKIGDENIRIYSYNEIALIFKEAFSYYKDLSQEELIHFLAEHQLLIEEAMKIFSHIVPIKFGTVVKDDEINEILKENYQKFKEIFEIIRGKVEWDLAATWSDLNLILREIGEKEPDLVRLREKVSLKPMAETFLDRVEMGKMARDLLIKKREVLSHEIFENIKELPFQHRFNNLMDDTMIINVALLIEKKDEEKLEERVKGLDKTYKDKINFRCIGPLPPYSFYTIKIKEKELAEKARQTLGINDKATLSEIKSVYRRMAKEFHPDKQEGSKCPATEEESKKFEELTKAYKTLLDYLKNPCKIEEMK